LPGQDGFGTIQSGFLEKSNDGPGWINGGVYILNCSLFKDFPMPKRFSFELDLVEPNIDRIQPRAFQSDAYFIDMGIPEDYQRAQHEIGAE
jgi:D-glycero-alpha-D-manno-heptose 1-phosphate guanylyltransferase